MIARLGAGARPDAIILSDYAKGVLTPEAIAAITRERGTAPLVVDPKHRDFRRYRTATTLTPTLRELEAAAGRTWSGPRTARARRARLDGCYAR